MAQDLRIPCPGADPVLATFRGGGRAEGVVVVHGILGCRDMPEIRDLAEVLAGERDVLAIDARGHGDDAGRFTWGREEWRQVDAAARWLAASGARRVSAVGFSYGDFHCARAVGRGTPIDRLVLVGAPADLGELDPLPFGRDFWRHVPAMLRRRRRRPRFERPPRLSRVALAPEDLGAIEVPTLVIHGGADWIVHRRQAEQYAAGIAGARLVEIPEGLHAEYLVDSHRDELFRQILAFLDAT